MKKVYTSLEAGSCVCLFPEGISRYQSGLAPLKNGVGRIALEVRMKAHRNPLPDSPYAGDETQPKDPGF